MSQQSPAFRPRGTVMVGGGDPGLCAQLGARGFQVRRAEDSASAVLALEDVDLVVLTSRWPHSADLAGTCAARGGPPVVWSKSGGSIPPTLSANSRAPQSLAAPLPRCGIVGNAPRFAETIERITWAAPSSAPVLLEGESGTGKERLATLLHDLAQRSGPFLKLSCSTLSAADLGAELQSIEALRPKRGTLLLDALGELVPDAQARLLQALEEGLLGETTPGQPEGPDLRLVGTCQPSLQRSVTAGRFRQDLYFRLAVLPIFVPPLRARREDLQVLVEHFLARFTHSGAPRVITQAALRVLTDHDWPGNVRELENLVRRLVLSSPRLRIEADQVHDELRRTTPPASPRPVTILSSQRGSETPATSSRRIQIVERDAIAAALEETSGNRAQAARLLGISVRTLYNRLKRYQAEGRPLLASR